jgi:hypothetical protein
MLVGKSEVKDDGVVVVSRSWPPSGEWSGRAAFGGNLSLP